MKKQIVCSLLFCATTLLHSMEDTPENNTNALQCTSIAETLRRDYKRFLQSSLHAYKKTLDQNIDINEFLAMGITIMGPVQQKPNCIKELLYDIRDTDG